MKLTYRHTLRACYLGFITQAISINLAPLLFIIFQDQFSVSDGQLGWLIFINFSTQIVADIFATRYVDRIGYRPAMLAGLFLSAVGLVALSILPTAMPNPYTGLVISVMLYSWGSGLLEVLISPIVESLPGDAKAAAMSLLHSFYCWGQMAVVIITTLLLKRLGHGVWTYLPLMWAVIPAIDFMLFSRVPLAPLKPEQPKMPLRKLLTSRLFVLAMLLMVTSGSSELTMSQWSSLFAERGLGVDKMTGDLLGMCLFAFFMGTGRMLYGMFGEKINLRRTLIASATLAVVCYGVTVFVLNPYISLVGCALCGLSVALMWPGTLSLSALKFPGGGTAMFGVLAISGDVGGSLGPMMAGMVSDAAQRSAPLMRLADSVGLQPDQLGLKAGLLAGIVFPLGMLMLLMFFREEKA